MILTTLMAAAANPFGTIKAPITGMSGTPEKDLSGLISVAVQSFIIVAALAALIYMLWGALEWVTSGGEKDKVAKAQQKITNAVIGVIAVVVAFTIFSVVAGNVLTVVDTSGGGIKLKLPSFQP